MHPAEILYDNPLLAEVLGFDDFDTILDVLQIQPELRQPLRGEPAFCVNIDDLSPSLYAFMQKDEADVGFPRSRSAIQVGESAVFYALHERLKGLRKRNHVCHENNKGGYF